MPLTEAEILELTADLKDARAAYRQLIMGQAVASWKDQNGEELTYNKADIDKLKAYIDQLKVDLASSNTSGSGPMEVWF